MLKSQKKIKRNTKTQTKENTKIFNSPIKRKNVF